MVAQSMLFGHLHIGYDRRVLEPRPWTAAQSQWVVDLVRELASPARLLELCAGTGHIGLLALSLAGAPVTPHRLVSVDVSTTACDHARRNAATAGLGGCVDAREGPVDEVLAPDERFDLVIADPPWVARSRTSRFPGDPLVAIDGGPDGLDVAWQCILVSEQHLEAGGSLVLQLGTLEQARDVEERLLTSGSTLSLRETRSFEPQGVLVRLAKETS